MKKTSFLLISFLLVLGSLVGREIWLRGYIQSQFISYYQSHQILSDAFVNHEVLSNQEPFDPNADTFVFNNTQSRIPPQAKIYDEGRSARAVLGESNGVKKIIVDLSAQRVYAYEDGRLVFNFLVSTGKWGATPTGTYRIWYKVRSQTMKGGNPAIGTYYYLPNVQWIQYFNKGIGFHSTYWHNNFGAPMSHGCVNMTTTDAETLYYWATPTIPYGVKFFRASDENPGTEVQVVTSWAL